jgi:hypothetical protein
MEGAAVDVHFDDVHMFLDLSDGQTVPFPLGCFRSFWPRQMRSANTSPSRWTASNCTGPKSMRM